MQPAARQQGPGLRVLYLGMLGQLSLIPLAGLLEAGVGICGVVVPAPAGMPGAPAIRRRDPAPQHASIPLINPASERTIIQLAWERQIPVFEVNKSAHPETLAALQELQPELACVSCFSQRLPASLLSLPPLGFLNLHPSLLPWYRGPAPLFWVFRNGERSTGVTIHFMDEELDAGDIALQQPVDLPDGISGREAEQRCAQLGAQLLAEAIRRLQQGRLQRHAQPREGSYYGWPGQEDFVLHAGWPARRAYNFMRGTAAWGMPYTFRSGDQQLALADAISYSESGSLGAAYRMQGNTAYIQLSPGILRARLSSAGP